VITSPSARAGQRREGARSPSRVQIETAMTIPCDIALVSGFILLTAPRTLYPECRVD